MRSLSVAANSQLLAKLQTDWPDSSAQNFSLTLPVNKFFEYEYNKHGTCAMQFYKLDWMHQSNPNPTLGTQFGELCDGHFVLLLYFDVVLIDLCFSPLDYLNDAVEFLEKYNVLGFFGFNVPKSEQYLTDYALGDYQRVKQVD